MYSYHSPGIIPVDLHENVTTSPPHSLCSVLPLSYSFAQDDEAVVLSKWYDVHCDGRVSYPEFLALLIELMISVREASQADAVSALPHWHFRAPLHF